jgi:hypothetical protein
VATHWIVTDQLKDSVGHHFTFFMDDGDENGNPDNIMFDGTVVAHPEYGVLAEQNSSGFYWRPHIKAADT